MKMGVRFLLFGIGAILLTALLYFIDTDPPYPEFRMTVIEFSVISVVFFLLFSIIYLVSRVVKRYIKF